MKVIFVGIHNKPGMTPLDSQTRSGKVIDRVIAQLPGVECLKSNFIDLDHYPDDAHDVVKYFLQWEKRVDYKKEDLVVALGDKVQDFFRQVEVVHMATRHPSRMSHEHIHNAIGRVIAATKFI